MGLPVTALEGGAFAPPLRVDARAQAHAARPPLRQAPDRVRPIGVVTPSLAEAACWRRRSAQAVTFATGAGDQRAQLGVRQLLEQDVSGLVSFGLAPGLAPALRPGDLVVASHVVLPSGEALPGDVAWREALLARLAGVARKVTVARIAGGERLDLSVAGKRRLFMATFAAALDTESAAVACAARAAGLPFLVVRAIADPAEEVLPAAAHARLRADGGTRPLAFAARLLARPGEIAAMWRFARIIRLAREALCEVAALMPGPPQPVPWVATLPQDASRHDGVACND